MVYNDQFSSFQEVPDRDNSFTVHHHSVQSLAIEMFKVINKIVQPLLTIYLPQIIVAIFAQNLTLLFQLCVQFITVKFL